VYTCGSWFVCAAEAVGAASTDPAIAAAIARAVANLRIGFVPHSGWEFVTNERYASVRGRLTKSNEIKNECGQFQT
jgi:hypothetical protein